MNTKKNVKRIAIQGGYGAFHEIAAKHYFENEEIEIVTANTFRDLFKSLRNNHADMGIMAIENSIAGSILPNYTLLLESNMKIIGEIYLRIQQNLAALPGTRIEDVEEVYSHPIALLQCQLFFDNYPHIKLVDSIDTALSAKEIAEKKLKKPCSHMFQTGSRNLWPRNYSRRYRNQQNELYPILDTLRTYWISQG